MGLLRALWGLLSTPATDQTLISLYIVYTNMGHILCIVYMLYTVIYDICFIYHIPPIYFYALYIVCIVSIYFIYFCE